MRAISNCKLILAVFFSCLYLISIGQLYNREKAVQYAELWWDTDEDNYNTDYDYHIGNNCANFVSQCIIAGGYNLDEGVDGNGLHVDNYGAIVNCDWLHLHLINYKVNDPNNDYTRHDDPDEPNWIDKADVAIFGSSSDYWQHAAFAVTGDDGVNVTYNANTNNRHHKPATFFYSTTWPSCDFYHIKDYIEPPLFCFNCIWDEDEGEIAEDCGGPCPPCMDAPGYKNYTSLTNNLPEVTFATSDITVDVVGNDKISVEPLQNVTFKAGNVIRLQPGFHAKQNSSFNALISKSSYEITRSCEQLCIPEYYQLYHRSTGGYWLDLVNISYYQITIYQWGGAWIQIFQDEGPIYTNGKFYFWDGCVGVQSGLPNIQFKLVLNLISCYEDYPLPIQMLIAFDDACNKGYESDGDLNQIDNDYFNEQKISIYPNPNAGEFNISFINEMDDASLQVYSSFGKLILTKEVFDSNKIDVDISDQPKGIYFVKILCRDQLITKKIIYQ